MDGINEAACRIVSWVPEHYQGLHRGDDRGCAGMFSTLRLMQSGHVFLSYMREDSQDADRLERALIEAGISVWRDRSSLWPGDAWRLKIRRAIAQAALVVMFFFSPRDGR